MSINTSPGIATSPFGAGSISYTDYNSLSWADASTVSATTIRPGLKVSGDCEVEGDITIGGTSLSDRLSAIEDRLLILKPAPEIESQWSELLELGKRYREVEADIRSKLQMIKIIKET